MVAQMSRKRSIPAWSRLANQESWSARETPRFNRHRWSAALIPFGWILILARIFAVMLGTVLGFVVQT